MYTYDCIVCRGTFGIAAAGVAVVGCFGNTDNLLRSMSVVQMLNIQIHTAAQTYLYHNCEVNNFESCCT